MNNLKINFESDSISTALYFIHKHHFHLQTTTTSKALTSSTTSCCQQQQQRQYTHNNNNNCTKTTTMQWRYTTWRRVSLIFFNFSRRSSSVSGSPSSWHKYQMTIWIYISKLKFPNIFLKPQISMANIILLKYYSPGAEPFDRPRQTSRSDSPCWSNNDKRKYVFNINWGAISSILTYLIWYSPPGRSSFLYPFLSLPKLDCF